MFDLWQANCRWRTFPATMAHAYERLTKLIIVVKTSRAYTEPFRTSATGRPVADVRPNPLLTYLTASLNNDRDLSDPIRYS